MIYVNGVSYQMDTFPDNTKKIAIPRSSYNFNNTEVFWQFNNDSETLLLYYICSHLRDNGYRLHRLVMPYVPNARMDRVKSKEEVFTLKYFASLINSLGFDDVLILDPHSNVSPALINNVTVLSPKPYIERAIEDINCEDLLIFYPDEGAMKRYSGMISKPYAFGVKNRDWQTGEIKSLSVVGDADAVKGRSVLIVDDICSFGGTFMYSAEKLKELGAAHIYLYVTHCENTILRGKIPTCDMIERVYTTNSLFSETHEKVRVFEIE